MVGHLGLFNDVEPHDVNICRDQHVVGVAAFLGVVRGSSILMAARGHEVGETEFGKRVEHEAVRKHIEVAADDERLALALYAADESDQDIRLAATRWRVALAGKVA